MRQENLVIFESEDRNVELRVPIEDETVWLTQAQMIELFGRDQSVISRHIRNIFRENELDEKSNMHFLHITNNELGEVIRIMKRVENRLDAKQVLSVIERYNTALDLLDEYDHQTMKKPEGNKAVYVLEYEECRKVIDSMKFGEESELFGNEKDDSFRGSIGAIYQTFGGEEVYPDHHDRRVKAGREGDDGEGSDELPCRKSGITDQERKGAIICP